MGVLRQVTQTEPPTPGAAATRRGAQPRGGVTPFSDRCCEFRSGVNNIHIRTFILLRVEDITPLFEVIGAERPRVLYGAEDFESRS